MKLCKQREGLCVCVVCEGMYESELASSQISLVVDEELEFEGVEDIDPIKRNKCNDVFFQILLRNMR